MFEGKVTSHIEDAGSTVSQVVEAVSDIALLVAADDRIREVHLGSSFGSEEASAWHGQAWASTVTPSTRQKVQELLDEARESGSSRSRQVNHRMPSGQEVAVGYTAVRLGDSGSVLAIGQSMEAVSRLQRQLVDAQQQMERDYWHLRQVETRYRLLFRLSSEAVVMVQADSLEVLDANPAAADVLGLDVSDLVGGRFPVERIGVEGEGLDEFFRTLREQGTAPGVTLSVDGGTEWLFKGSLVRQEGGDAYLIHLYPEESDGGAPQVDPTEVSTPSLLRVLQAMPDGFLVTDTSGEILHANAAFLDMTQESSLEAVRGRSLSEWLARPGADLTVLMGNLKRYGVIRLFPTQVNGAMGGDVDVEVSAVYLEDEPEPCCGVLIRHVGRRISKPVRGLEDLTTAVEEMTRLLGSVTLRKLVRETVAMVERHFIEAALELTGDNRTAASELLGLSRQSLYTKLKRYDIDSPSSGSSA